MEILMSPSALNLQGGKSSKPYENMIVSSKKGDHGALVPYHAAKQDFKSDINKCPCCGDLYSPLLKQNRVLLSCLHSVCAVCVRMVADLLVSLKGEDENSQGQFMCPFCHTMTAIAKGEQWRGGDCRQVGATIVIGEVANVHDHHLEVSMQHDR